MLTIQDVFLALMIALIQVKQNIDVQAIMFNKEPVVIMIQILV
jgi:Na+-transporting NADH:ubiquinone oxidoreductase subunit NqrB